MWIGCLIFIYFIICYKEAIRDYINPLSENRIIGFIDSINLDEKLVAFYLINYQFINENEDYLVYRDSKFIGKVRLFQKVCDGIFFAKIVFITKSNNIEVGDRIIKSLFHKISF